MDFKLILLIAIMQIVIGVILALRFRVLKKLLYQLRQSKIFTGAFVALLVMNVFVTGSVSEILLLFIYQFMIIFIIDWLVAPSLHSPQY